MYAMLRVGLVFSACAVLGLLAGCGGQPPRVKVHGKVTMKGQPLRAGPRKPGNMPSMMVGEQLQKMEPPAVEKMESLSVVYYPLTATGETDKQSEFFWASVKPDGNYEVLGKEGKGIPPGRYRISVILPAAFTNEDKLKGTFGPDNSKIIRTVPQESKEQEINIDLTRPEG
jgi:hypothetical protein